MGGGRTKRGLRAGQGARVAAVLCCRRLWVWEAEGRAGCANEEPSDGGEPAAHCCPAAPDRRSKTRARRCPSFHSTDHSDTLSFSANSTLGLRVSARARSLHRPNPSLSLCARARKQKERRGERHHPTPSTFFFSFRAHARLHTPLRALDHHDGASSRARAGGRPGAAGGRRLDGCVTLLRRGGRVFLLEKWGRAT